MHATDRSSTPARFKRRRKLIQPRLQLKLTAISTFVALIALLGLFALPTVAEARCYAFRGQNIRVCVSGNDGGARRTATAVCERVTGSSCSISGDSGECRRSWHAPRRDAGSAPRCASAGDH